MGLKNMAIGKWVPVLATAAMGLMTLPARADHSLQYAMEDSPELGVAVTAAMADNDLSCDLGNSRQLYYDYDEIGRSGTAWRQVSFCNDSASNTVALMMVSYRDLSGIAFLTGDSTVWQRDQDGPSPCLINSQYQLHTRIPDLLNALNLSADTFALDFFHTIRPSFELPWLVLLDCQ